MKKTHKITLIVVIAGVAGAILLGALPSPPSGAGNPTAQAERTAAAALTVSVANPTRDTWPIELEASGWMQAWQEVVISTEVGGQMIKTLNADVGDKVTKGDLLAELSRASLENDVRELDASFESAKAGLEQATADADRARRLQTSGSGSISQQQVSEYLVAERQAKADVASAEAKLASAQLDLEATRIMTLSDGVISSRSATLGGVVSEGEEMFRLIRDNRIEWQAEVPLSQVFQINVGTAVSMPTPKGNIAGTVRQIAPSASGSNGRVKVYVDLEAPKEGIDPKINVMTSGVFQIGESEALSVPSSAVVLQDGYNYVFVLDQEDGTTVHRQRVDTGRREGNLTELVGDFAADALVVQSGGAFLSEGSTVKVVADSARASADESKTTAVAERGADE